MSQQQQRVPTITDDSKYCFYGRKAEGAQRAPKGFFSEFKGNISFNVWPNDPSYNGKPLRFGMDVALFNVFLEKMEEIIASKEAVQDHIVIKTGKPTDLREVGTIIIGKNDKGVVYIAAKTSEVKPIQMLIRPNRYMDLVRADGTPYSEGEMSSRYAKGLFKLLGKVLVDRAIANYEAPTFGNKGGNGGGNRNGGGFNGGGNRGGYGGGNNNTNFDDDIPM